jgi:hypothetical protein
MGRDQVRARFWHLRERTRQGEGWFMWPYMVAMLVIELGAAVRFLVLSNWSAVVALMLIFLPVTIWFERSFRLAWTVHRRRPATGAPQEG